MVWLSEQWRLWDQFAVRGAGFPADGVLRLAPPGLAEVADQLDLSASTGQDRQLFDKRFAAAALDTVAELQSVAALPAFQAAVAWQNPAVLDRGIGLFLAWDTTVDGRTSKRREREELVAHYWQRFCVKNDTIGFFGPVGWGSWDDAVRGLAVDTGAGLVARTNTYFATWAVDTVAAAIEADPAAARWIAPRRVPFVRYADGTATVPGRPPQPVPPELRPVLDRCDGVTSAGEIQRLLGDGTDVLAALAELRRRRWVVWRLAVPASARPERYLRDWLTAVGDREFGARWLALLDELDQARDRVAAATPAALPAELAALQAVFTESTGAAAARTKGVNTAPGRGLVYADCTRAGHTRLGPEVLTALAPLELLLTSAAWLTDQLARHVVEQAVAVHDTLAADGPVDLAAFWFACMPILHGCAGTVASELRTELVNRWSAILAVPAGARRVQLSTSDIADRVRAGFGEPGVGWNAARYLSPDLFLLAADEDAVAGGDFSLVLGELHVASNTLGASLYLNQHPAPAELLAETDRDFPVPRLLPAVAKENRSRLSIRVRQSLTRPQDHHVVLVDHTVDPATQRVVPSAEVVVERTDDTLTVVLPGGARFPAVDVFGHVLTTLAMDLFDVLPAGGHSPRVTVDKLVVARESWTLRVGDLGWADVTSEADRFVAARRWSTGLGLPRFVFIVSATEPRPFYVDFAAPVYVNIMAKAVRRAARQDPDAVLTITEMLPTPEQAWLRDADGNRYSAELRFVAVRPAE